MDISSTDMQVKYTDVGEKACAWDVEFQQAICKLCELSYMSIGYRGDKRTSHAAYSYNFFHLGDVMFVC